MMLADTKLDQLPLWLEDKKIPLGIALLLLLAALAVAYATRLGPWIHSDSVEYIVSARNLLRGQGLGLIKPSGEFQPIYLHPPFFPFALAIGGALGLDLVVVARWMNVVFFALTVLMASGLLYYATRSYWLAAAAGLLTLTNPDFFWVSSGAMPEPMFYFLGLAGILLLLIYLQAVKAAYLLVAGVAVGITLLLRFPGAAFLAAGLAGLLLFARGGWRRRLIDAGIFAAIGGVPFLIWWVWVSSHPEAGSPRQWTFALADAWEKLTPFRIEFVNVVWDWLPFNNYLPALSYRPKPRIMAVALLAFFVVLGLALRRRGPDGQYPWKSNRALQLLVVLLGVSVASVAVVAAVFAFSTPALDPSDVDGRILLPLRLSLSLAVLSAAYLVFEAWPRQRWTRWLMAAFTLLLVSWQLPQTWKSATELHDTGAGMIAWRNSEMLNQIQALPGDIPIISNESATILFYLDRPTYDIPDLITREPTELFTRFGQADTHADRLFREEGAALALFYTAPYQFYWIYFEDTEQRLSALTDGLYVYSTSEAGTVYFYEEPANQ
jgi:4-amino-4-deoxy-L-arabinose transferase-like glycosyltransferase